MKKNFPFFAIFMALILVLFGEQSLFSQNIKKNIPPSQPVSPGIPTLKNRDFAPAVPAISDPFSVGKMSYQPISPLVLPAEVTLHEREIMTDEETGLPYFWKQETEASAIQADSEAPQQAIAFLSSLKLPKIQNATAEFQVSAASVDDLGNHHVRLQQFWKGVEVFASEVVVHSHHGYFDLMNGRYEPSPVGLTTVVPTLTAASAIALLRQQTNDIKVWSETDLLLVGGTAHEARLVVFFKEKTPHLAYHITARPDLLHRMEYFMDAHTGVVLHSFDHTCEIAANLKVSDKAHFCAHHEHQNTPFLVDETPEFFNGIGMGAGPVTGSGSDLLGTNRTFGAYEQSGTVYMIDTRKSMYNASASSFPGNPIGTIVTLDAQNTSPQNNNFTYRNVTSTSNTFNNQRAVSAHWNSNLSFDYFKSTFNRNSINGTGGNIIAFVNVAEDDGSSMENAFWNGSAMWYGNGGTTFFPLARSLDVGGHEMTHGVVEKTANLVYQNESGALNESFADIFASMIDRDDWLIGEDVMRAGVSPGGALRSMSNPHNGASNSNSQWWQPKHYSERYTGTQDNGGVHINSGITNYAYYLFATNSAVGRDKAERVFYKALTDYLTKNSRFTDCRAAVVQAATDLYGAAVTAAAASAFDAVGIAGPSGGGGGGGTPTGPVTGNLANNPGTPYLLVTTEDKSTLQLANSNGVVLGNLYTQGIASRPSVTDNGSEVVFINDNGDIVDIFLQYGGGNITPTVEIISNNPDWRNVAISKNGRFIAALSKTLEPTIHVYDFGVSPVQYRAFELYNPTYTNGQITRNVNYADVLDFDYSGEFLMYDAENAISDNQGNDLSYWDISFLQFFDNNTWTNGVNRISKLFNGLPERVSVGNPVFSKNSPNVIAFDLIDGINDRYHVYGANVETGDNNIIVNNVGDLGYPNFDRTDQSLVYNSNTFLTSNIRRQGLATSKIAPSGNSTAFVSSKTWGVWFANGNRNLQVGTDAPEANPSWMRLAPNPTAQNSLLSIVVPNSEEVRVQILDIAGRVLQNKQYALVTGENQLLLDMSELPNGTYFVALRSANRTATAQIVVQK